MFLNYSSPFFISFPYSLLPFILNSLTSSFPFFIPSRLSVIVFFLPPLLISFLPPSLLHPLPSSFLHFPFSFPQPVSPFFIHAPISLVPPFIPLFLLLVATPPTTNRFPSINLSHGVCIYYSQNQSQINIGGKKFEGSVTLTSLGLERCVVFRFLFGVAVIGGRQGRLKESEHARSNCSHASALGG